MSSTCAQQLSEPCADSDDGPQACSAYDEYIAVQIATSTDGKAFANVKTGTWADTADNKTEAFAASTAKYVRLTCTTEAGGRVRIDASLPCLNRVSCNAMIMTFNDT